MNSLNYSLNYHSRHPILKHIFQYYKLKFSLVQADLFKSNSILITKLIEQLCFLLSNSTQFRINLVQFF